MRQPKAIFLLAAATSLSAQQSPPASTGTMTELGTLGGSRSSASAVSANGSAVVGFAYGPGNQSRAFLWTSAGMADLGTFGGSTSSASAVSADGSVIVGDAEDASGNYRAFRWTAGTMTYLGTFGGNYAKSAGVSADGSVVVGSVWNSINQVRAFRWTATGGMVDLGTLGGLHAQANAVSADGSAVVGLAFNVTNQFHAFRWTAAGGITDLGTFGGILSEARAVSADGSVVVGSARNASGSDRAFRWTAAGGMIDLGTFGGRFSVAYAVSADGSVVVGLADSTNRQTRAFRWTATGGMIDLGTLGGTISAASAVSADGSVVVGTANNYSNKGHAFRWTAAGGMTDLGTFGGTISYANAVSADGSVVVGYARNASEQDRAFIYKSRVMLDVQDWLGSVGGVNSFLSASEELARLHLEGAHHRPLADLGKGSSYWVTGDIASSSRSRDLLTRSGEAGATFAPANNLLIGIGGGYGLQDQDLANAGSARSFGQYLVAEIDLIRPDGGIFSLLGSFGDWRDTYDRGYVTGSGVDYSHGQTNLTSKAFRLRYDSASLGKAFGTDFKAYVSYAHLNVASEAFAETSGSYAGSFGAMDHTAKEGRLGLTATKAFGETVKVRLSAEWIRRYDHDAAPLTVTDITSTLALALPTPDPVRDQARVGVDVDYALDKRTTLSLTVHASGRGESPDVSGAISLRRSF